MLMDVLGRLELAHKDTCPHKDNFPAMGCACAAELSYGLRGGAPEKPRKPKKKRYAYQLERKRNDSITGCVAAETTCVSARGGVRN